MTLAAARKLVTMAGEFDREVATLLDLFPRWARRRADVRGLALVGSWARGTPRPDSDVDLILLTVEPGLYTGGEGWIAELGGVAPVATRPWGAITERRFSLPSGLEVEVGVGRPPWASITPVDEGTRRVATDGLVALHDPDRLLGELLEHCRGRDAASPSASDGLRPLTSAAP